VTTTCTYIWSFKVRAEHVESFRRSYGEGGAWTRLFRRARGYLGTQLLRDEQDALRFVTIDTWARREDYDAFRASFASEYAALDRRCEGLTTEETCIGHFVSED
jgi:heme-degrading monooxygenase HmoA